MYIYIYYVYLLYILYKRLCMKFDAFFALYKTFFPNFYKTFLRILQKALSRPSVKCVLKSCV